MQANVLLDLFPTHEELSAFKKSLTLESLLNAHPRLKEDYDQYTEAQLDKIESCYCIIHELNGTDIPSLLVKDGNTGIIYIEGLRGFKDVFHEGMPYDSELVIKQLSNLEKELVPYVILKTRERDGYRDGLPIKTLTFFFPLNVLKGENATSGVPLATSRVYLGSDAYPIEDCEHTLLAQLLFDYDVYKKWTVRDRNFRPGISCFFSSKEVEEFVPNTKISIREFTFGIDNTLGNSSSNHITPYSATVCSPGETEIITNNSNVTEYKIRLKTNYGEKACLDASASWLEAIGKIALKFKEAGVEKDSDYLIRIFDKLRSTDIAKPDNIEAFLKFFEV